MIINHHRYCLQQLQMCLDIPGDVLECGIGRGNNSLQMGAWLRDFGSHKNVYACDTFDGLPYTDEETSHIKSDLKKGECIHRTFPEFVEEIEKQKLAGWVTPIEGLIEETLDSCLGNKTFCFAWLDVDLYYPTDYAWKWLQDKMPVGAVIGIHDYKYWRCPGIQQFVEKEITKFAGKWDITYLKGTSIFFKRII